MPTQDTVVIIPAAGQGKRMGAGNNKLLLSLGNTTILGQTLHVFLSHPRISKIYLAIAEQDREVLHPLLEGQPQIIPVPGGQERQDSVHNALEVIKQQPSLPQWVLVHDGARPLCSHELIDRVLERCETAPAVIPVLPLMDTIRRITPESTQVVDRNQLVSTQTPQGFQTKLLLQANHQSRQEHWHVTDDASLVEKMGISVETVPGETTNLKITTPLDLHWSRWWLSQEDKGAVLN